MYSTHRTKGFIKNNLIFFLFIFIILLGALMKDSRLQLSLVAHPDSVISYSFKEGIFEQSWLSNVKKLTEVAVPYMASGQAQGEVKLSVLEGKEKKEIATVSQDVSFTAGERGELTFPLENLRLKQGEQYFFRLEGGTGLDKLTLEIDAGSNYAGCTVGDIQQNKGANLQLTFLKTNLVSWLLLTFFPFISLSFLYMTAFERKFEETIGLALISVLLLLFGAGIAGVLEAGIRLVYFLSAIAFLVGVFLFNKKGMVTKRLWSPGVLIYGVLLLLILANCQNLRMARWDEFSHWGLVVKDMFFFDSLPKHFETTVLIADYPPAIPLIQYFFLYVNQLFADHFMYVGFQVLMLSMLIVGISFPKGAKGRLGGVLVALLVLLFVPLTFFGDTYNSLYADPMLAYGVAYVLICYYRERFSVFNLLRITAGLFLITMTKHTGLVLAAMVGFIMLGDVLYQQYRSRKWELKKLGLPVLCIVMVGVFFLTWQTYLSTPITRNMTETVDAADSQATEAQSTADADIREEEAQTLVVKNAVSKSGISIGKILDVFTGRGEEVHYQIIKNYIQKLSSDQIYGFGPVSLSCIDVLAIFILIGVLYSALGRLGDSKKEVGSFCILASIGALGYIGFLLITYLFSFSSSEGVLLSSYSRYIASFLAGLIIALLNIIIHKSTVSSQQKNIRQVLFTVIAAFIFIVTPFEMLYIRNMDTELTEDEVYGFSDIMEILRSTAGKGEQVYFVCNNSDGHAYMQFRNTIVPLKISSAGYNLFSSKEAYLKQAQLYEKQEIEMHGNNTVLTAEEWGNRLEDYEYVVLFSINDVFMEGYGELFTEPETIDDGTVYRVEKEGEAIRLSYIGKVGIKSFR